MRISCNLAFSLVATCVALGGKPGELRTEVQMESLRTGLNQFKADLGRYPTSAEGLASLLRPPDGIPAAPPGPWHGPYVESVQDAWRREFVYRCPGFHNTNGYDLYSRGEDGVSASGGNDPDDINSWDPSRSWRRHYLHVAQMRRIGPFAYGIVAVLCLACLAWWTRLISRKGERAR